MAHWLLKEEPTCYPLDHLERDGRTSWDGVRNPLALKHLRAMRPGDRAWYYHTGKEKAIVGEVEIVRAGAGPDGAGPPSVEIAFLRRLARPVTLAMLKQVPELADWELVRLPRLSVMPVTPAQWQQVEQLAAGPR